jgi:pyruvate dehydrogenase E1 component
MLEKQCDEFFYLTVTNENYRHEAVSTAEYDAIVKGMRKYANFGGGAPSVRLLGSGALLKEVIAAGDLLARDWHVASEVWSVTSFSELARQAAQTERESLFSTVGPQSSYVAQCLPGTLPVIAASDYVRAYPQLIASYLQAPFTALGTDGFGRSDTRSALRRFFEVDRWHIVLATLSATHPEKHAEAVERYGIEKRDAAPWTQ